MAKKIKPLHPIDNVILRTLARTKLQVTPTEISRAIGVHPVTAQKHIKKLKKDGALSFKKTGNRIYVNPLNLTQIRKFLIRRKKL